MQPESGWIVYADLTSCIWFGSILLKKAWIILCKTGPDPIWMAWSGFGQKCARITGNGSGRMQPALLPVSLFRLCCILPQMAQIILCSASPDLILVWQTVWGFIWPNGSGAEASQRATARFIKPFPGDSDWMQIRSGRFTGSVFNFVELVCYKVRFHGFVC